MDEYYNEYRASIHRGVYPLAARATDAYEGARERVAAFAGSTPGETVFTRNATEAINLVAYAWGRANVGAGDLVLVTQMEHHSNLVPWQLLCSRDRRGAGLRAGHRRRPARPRGARRPAGAPARSCSPSPTSPTCSARSTRSPRSPSRAHAAGALVMVDGAQAVPHLPVDVGALGADFYAWTGHKAYGPTGIGVLHGRRELLEAMPPFLGGGHMISRVGDFESQWAEPPARFEAGTMPIAEAIGLGAAVDYLAGLGMDAVWEHSRDVIGYAVERLRRGARAHAPRPARARAPRQRSCSFALEGVHPHDVAEILGREGVCVRAGHHCAQPLMRRLGVPATSRASFAVHSTREDVDRLIDGPRPRAGGVRRSHGRPLPRADPRALQAAP